MIRTTRWSPDTCGCVLEFEWDDALPPEMRTHSPSRVVTACPAHQGKTVTEAFAAVGVENRRKNAAFAHLLENFPALVASTLDEEGNQIRTLRGVAFRFDSNRVLRLAISGATLAQRIAIRAALRNALPEASVDVD